MNLNPMGLRTLRIVFSLFALFVAFCASGTANQATPI